MNFTATSCTASSPAKVRTPRKKQRWTPSEYRILYDKLHGTDTAGVAKLQYLASSQICTSSGDKNIELLNKRQVLAEEWTDKNRANLQKEYTKTPAKIATTILYNEVDRKKMLEIFRIRSNRDDDWSPEEANQLMKKWFGPELLWTDAERAIFTEDENWDTADDFITDEEQAKLYHQLFPYFGTNTTRDRAKNTGKSICKVDNDTRIDESDGNTAASNTVTDDSNKGDGDSFEKEDGDSEDTTSAVSDDEIDVVNIEKATKKLMGMIAYEKHVETFMAIDVKEMQKLMFQRMNEDEDIQKVFMQHSSFSGRL